MALHPNFPRPVRLRPLHARRRDRRHAPRWGTPASPPTRARRRPARPATAAWSAAASRACGAGNVMTGAEQVLIEDWCQQYPSHSIGSLAFGPDGALYVSGGDGASFNFADYGQDGSPVEPVRRPAGASARAHAPPTAEGGALRSQDLRTTGDPADARRHDPPRRPRHRRRAAGQPARRQQRRQRPPDRRPRPAQPVPLHVPPGHERVWIGDVGWNDWEEINRIVDPTDGVVENFGWPCYEGTGRQAGYDGANLTHLREPLRARPDAVTAPYFAYSHTRPGRARARRARPAARRSPASRSTTAAAVPGRVRRRAVLRRLLARLHLGRCSAGGERPARPGNITTLRRGRRRARSTSRSARAATSSTSTSTAARSGGSSSLGGNQPPTAVATADPTSGAAPLTVTFDGTGRATPTGDTLSYAWDLDGDGAVRRPTAPQPTCTYTSPGPTRSRSGSPTPAARRTPTRSTITVGNTAPCRRSSRPPPATTWAGRRHDLVRRLGHRRRRTDAAGRRRCRGR